MKSLSGAALLYLTLFVVLSAPFGLALLPQNVNQTEFSIYNTGWDGTSQFRSILSTDYPNVQIKTLIGSANVLNRLNDSVGANSGALVIMGPKVHYDPFEAIAILLYAAKGGRVLIADDYGTGNDILSYFSMLIKTLADTNMGGTSGTSAFTNAFGFNQSTTNVCASITNQTKSNPFPIIGLAINQSVLVDTQSYYKSPLQPIFTPPATSGLGVSSYTELAPWLTPMIKNVSSVIGNYAATISMKVQYPVNFTKIPTSKLNVAPPADINALPNVINSSVYFNLPNLNPPDSADYKCYYNPSYFKQIWTPFSEFPASLTQIPGLPIPADFKFDYKLSALYSSQESFLVNTTAAKNPSTLAPSSSMWGNIEFPIAVDFPFGTGPNAGSLTIISDPSIFINRYLRTTPYPLCTSGSSLSIGSSCEQDPNFNPANYDNRQFAMNVLTLLTGDRPNGVVYFDEGHLAQSFLSPTLYLGFFFRFLDFMSMVPLIAPFLPFLVYGFARKLAPKGTTGRALLKTKAENYYGRSYFAFKMRWFLENRHFTRGLELIYRRTRRDLMKRYKMDTWNPETAVMLLNREYSGLRKNLLKKVLEIENIFNHHILIEEQQFMDLYLVLQEINNHIKI